MFANRLDNEFEGGEMEKWVVSGIVCMETYNRDFLIGLFVCLVRNFLPKLIDQF